MRAYKLPFYGKRLDDETSIHITYSDAVILHICATEGTGPSFRFGFAGFCKCGCIQGFTSKNNSGLPVAIPIHPQREA